MSHSKKQPPEPAGPPLDPAFGESVDNDAPAIGMHDPASVPRAEEDAAVYDGSIEFQDQPGSGKHLGGPSMRDARDERGPRDEGAPDDGREARERADRGTRPRR